MFCQIFGGGYFKLNNKLYIVVKYLLWINFGGRLSYNYVGYVIKEGRFGDEFELFEGFG